MRTTVSIADDVFFAVKEQAKRERRSAGDVISDLLRQALTKVDQPSDPEPSGGREARLRARGFRPLPHRGAVVTNDLVNRLREDLEL